jgi:hypothetical protein
MKYFIISLVCLFSSAFAESTLKDIVVAPETVLLDHKHDYQDIITQAIFTDGTSNDIKGDIKVSIVDKSVCGFKNGRFTPIKDGITDVNISYQGKVKTLKVTVKNSSVKNDISFKLDVMPIFTKSGCNSGGCHGASRGKDKFMLKLYGFDPDGDYQRLTTEFPGRRINMAVPEDSMLLMKAVNSVPHTGGKLFEIDSYEYKAVLEWLKNGANADKKAIKTPVKLEIYPKETVLVGQGSQKLSVRVTYSDGTDRDVTNLTNYISSDTSVAFINKEGKLANKNPGDAYLMARFGTLTALTRLISLPANAPEIKSLPGFNYIDKLVNSKLMKLRIKSSGLCSDEVFLRRIFLDITGQLPSEADFHKFMKDKSAGKRAELVDELLQKPEFIDVWVMKWAELLQIRSSNNFSYKSTLLYYNWLKKKFSDNVPIDKVVFELLSSSGSTFKNPPTNFYQIERDTLKRTENVAQVFMGTRIQCAQCHNHPFDRWTMNDYYSFSAFFSQIGVKNDEDPRARIIYDNRRGGVKHPVSKSEMAPVFLGGTKPELKSRDRRLVVAEWLISKENPYFAQSLVNRIWEQFFGRGITHPVDDARLSNPPSNKELLDELSRKLVEYNFDFKKLVSDICNSRTYQLESKSNSTNKLDNRNFSHAAVRRIRAEILLDSISLTTATKDKFRSLPLGAKAVQIADGKTSSYFLQTFGRASRETVCSCEVSMEPNLSQALHLLNGSTVSNKIRAGRFIDEEMKKKQTPEAIIRKLYIKAYSREVKDQELEKLLPFVIQSKNKKETLEDIFWALLNSKEFIFVR